MKYCNDSRTVVHWNRIQLIYGAAGNGTTSLCKGLATLPSIMIKKVFLLPVLLLGRAATNCAFLFHKNSQVSTTSRPRTNGLPLINNRRYESQKESQFSSDIETETSSDEKFIKESLLQNTLFTALPNNALVRLVDAFEKKISSKDDIIFCQGDNSCDDYVYMVAEGECAVTVDGVMPPEPYGTIGPSVLFGDLGIL